MSLLLRVAAAVCTLATFVNAQSTAEDWRQKANALYGDKKFADAIKAYDRSIALDPNNPRAYVGRGSSYKGLNQTRQSLENYNRAIELNPNYSNAYMNRAGLYYQTGDLQAALADYNRSIELDPNNAPALFSRGLLYTKLNDPASAAADLNKSLETDPNGPYAANARTTLARLPAVPAAPKPAATPAATIAPAPAPAALPRPALNYSASLDKLSIPHSAFQAWPFSNQRTPLPPLPDPPPGLPAYLPENLDINHIGPAAYDASLRAAREGVRLLRGTMSPQDEEKFELIWAPVFEYPCQPVVEYFNKLTPLLNRFIETRAALQRALLDFNNSYEEAIIAAGLGDGDAVREAMDVAGVQRNSIAALDIRLNAIAKDIEALGDPPDPLSHRKRARDLNDETARFIKGKPAGGTYWVLANAKADNNPKTSDGNTKFTHVVTDGYARGSYLQSYVPYGETQAKRRSAVGELHWTPPPPVLPAPKFLDFEYTMDVRLTCTEVVNYGLNENKDDCARIFIDPSATTNNFARLTPVQPSFSGPIRIEMPRIGQFKQSLPLKVKIEVATPGGYTHFWYTYELRDLTPEQVSEIRARAAQSAQGRADAQSEAAAKSNEMLTSIYDAQTQQEAKLEAIAFARENQKYFQAKLDEYRNAANNASPADQARFKYLAMVMDANLQAERDNQSTMETGQWTRTRTEYDDWNFQLMAAQSQAAARDWQQREEANAALFRIVNLFPKELRDVERSAALKAAGEAIARGDTAGVRNTVAGLAARSKEYWSLQSTQQQAFATNADLALTSATVVKYGAAVAAGALAVPLGTGYFIGYMGVTGGVEGGVEGGLNGAIQGATRGAIMAAHPAAMIALSAYDGYNQTVINAETGKQEKAGITGAAQGAAEAAVFALLTQKVVAPAIGKAVGWWKGPPPLKPPSVQEYLAEATLKSRMANGRAKVKLFKERVQLAQLAGSSNDPKLVAELNAKAAEAAKAIKCDYAAKMALNQSGKADPATMKAYLAQDQRLMAEVQQEFKQAMSQRGYGPVEIRSYSNSASAGKAGMDVDIGIVEPTRLIRGPAGQAVKNPQWETWRRNSITQTGADGKPQMVSIQHYQRAGQENLQRSFDKIYGGTGRPTGDGFVNFTTSAHAEAYVDAAWIGRRGLPHADFESILPGTAKQAGEVTSFKVSHLINTPGAEPDYLKLQEGCRTLVKDINTKLVGSTTSTINPQAPLAKAGVPVQQHVLKLRAAMDSFAKNEIGPIDADRAIRELTGGEGLPAVVKQFQSLLVAGSK